MIALLYPRWERFILQCLATFDTTHMALKFEKKCRKAGLDVRVIPVPRELSSSCGFACSYPCSDRTSVEEIARSDRIDVADFHEII